MSNRTELYINGILTTVFLGTTIFALPYIVSAIFLYKGSSLMEAWLESNGIQPGNANIEKAMSIPLTSDAAGLQHITAVSADLEHAVKWDSRNARAKIALAQAYLLLKDYTSASRVLDRYQPTQPEEVALVRNLRLALGYAFATQGEFQRAQAEWERVDLAVDIEASRRLTEQGSLHLKATDFAGEADKLFLREGDGRITMLINSSLTKSLFFTRSGNHKVTLRSKNSIPGPVELVVAIDHSSARLLFEANDSSWSEKMVELTVQAGVRSLAISFVNDYFGPDGDRNAELEWVEVRAP